VCVISPYMGFSLDKLTSSAFLAGGRHSYNLSPPYRCLSSQVPLPYHWSSCARLDRSDQRGPHANFHGQVQRRSDRPTEAAAVCATQGRRTERLARRSRSTFPFLFHFPSFFLFPFPFLCIYCLSIALHVLHSDS
jgi:hypothetical protein